jgi:hypothetical protein
MQYKQILFCLTNQEEGQELHHCLHSLLPLVSITQIICDLDWMEILIGYTQTINQEKISRFVKNIKILPTTAHSIPPNIRFKMKQQDFFFFFFKFFWSSFRFIENGTAWKD